ncbi:MAG TPA: (deoxy)nucleoside triphosphate pyrophosphohydrolase [Candidatus Acidoferrales bacterium]|jgi:8-oxo-dGTP diphosphatase|nr:(deoxy)nucleoside triphosphate pyrophosphohydrolase [Candidatus Acidoferrales bacterium]
MLTVVAAIIEHEGKLLVCQRKRGRNFELMWEFPGGKVESGETPQAALARELQEELGVHADIGAEIYRTRHQYKELPQAFELIFLSATIADPDQVTNLEFESIEWRTPDSLLKLNFLSADRELVRQLATGHLRGNGSAS